MISAVNVFRNCIENGYPFVESILSIYPMVCEYHANDGGSTDGTLEVLQKLAEKYPKIILHQIPDIENIRWDSCTIQSNQMIKQCKGDYIWLGNADELLHEADLHKVSNFIHNKEWPITRYQRYEVTQDWSRLSREVYHPARVVKNKGYIRMDWNGYGGDEFIVDGVWIDPDRKLQAPHTLYHLLNMFSGNRMTKLKHDAEYISPGDRIRVKHYNDMKGSSFSYRPPKNVMDSLPALCYGLQDMEYYMVRDELFDVEYVEELCSLNYK